MFTAQSEERAKALADYLATGGAMSKLTGISDKALEAIYFQAFQQYKNGHYLEAAKIFQFLCFYDQWNPRHFLGLGSCQKMLHVYGQAINTYSYAARLEPQNPLPLAYIGDCYFLEGEPDKAALSYKAAIKISEKYAFHHKEITRIKDCLANLSH